jgi:CPA2 family monovalent cation:H+ antiporter-2
VEGLGIGRDLLVVLVAAIAGGVLARWLRLPVILGYLAGGVAVGPFGPPAVRHRPGVLPERAAQAG